MSYLMKEWARTKKDLKQADVATLSGGLISQPGVSNAWREDASGSQSRSGQLPGASPEGRETRPRGDIELNDNLSPQQPWPGAPGPGGIDAPDPASAAASDGSAVRGGPGW
ncbi:hypothetical protein GCM10010429_48790 [Micromonospora olivasterospora]